MKEKELLKIDDVTKKVSDSNLDNDAKSFVLEVLKKYTFELQTRISRIQNDTDEYHK